MAREFNRRDFVKTVTVAGTVGMTGLAGCLGEDDPIPMGSILPITGGLEDFGEGMEIAVNMAVDHVNEAGGPLGREIDMFNRDSETQAAAGVDRYESLVSDQDIVGFVGAASSGVSAPIAEQVAEDRVMQVSPASTSFIFVDIGWLDPDDRQPGTKYFGRTAPNDAQQGIVMARVLDNYLEADTVGFIYVDNPYGEGLYQVAEENYSGEVVSAQAYDEEQIDFASVLDAVFAQDPDAIAFVGYPGEGDPLMTQWDEGGYGGEWVLSEGLNSSSFINDHADILDGFYITTPDPEDSPGRDAFHADFPDDLEDVFAPHSYDALFLMALAMHAGGEASGEAIAQNIVDVANPPGEVVTYNEFDRAVELLDDGEDVQYQGASSPLELNDDVENLNRFSILQITGGATETIETLERDWFL